MDKFNYVAMPGRVVFGNGRAAELAAEVELLGVKRPLLLSTPGRSAMLRTITKGLKVAGTFDKAVMHTPAHAVETARKLAEVSSADSCIAVGGGSTIGFAKAIALQLGLPIIAVPTTYSGSEMTTIWGISEGGAKKTGRDAKVLPKVVIYDPQLTLELSPAASAASGMNAIAHCAEALYAHDGNPITSLMAEEGIRALAGALPAIMENPKDLDARGRALYGAWLAGSTISTVSVALHHKLCHVLGGLGLPHAETHSVVLPHALHYNAKAAGNAMLRISRALGAEGDAPGAMWDLQKRLGLPMALVDIGLKRVDIEKAAKTALAAPYPNPRPVEYNAVLKLLNNAYEGNRP